MTYTARSRDRFRLVASTTTGVIAAACVAGTGAVMGTASAANAQGEVDKAAARQREALAQPNVIEVSRPSAVATKIKVVTKPGSGPKIRVVRVAGGSGSSGGSSSSSGSRKSAPKPVKSSGS